MIPFLPDTPLTVAYAVALALTCGVVLWRAAWLWPAIAVMVANWLATRAITHWALPSWCAFIADLISAIVLIWLWRKRAMAVLPVAALFALMLTCYLANDLEVIGREVMWAFVDVAAYGQLVILAALGIGGGGARRRSHHGADRAGGDDLAGAVAQRLPHR